MRVMSPLTRLTKAIKFRLLADQLTDTEFTTFVKQAIKQYDRSIILTPIFNQYSGHSSSSPRPDRRGLDKLITIIKTIMTQRKPAKKSEIGSNPKPVTMLSLSSALIGEIGSLLDQKSHMRFSRCSRDIHIGCQSPCTLRSLSLLGTSSYDRVDLRDYAQIRSIQLDPNFCTDLPMPLSGILCRSLSTLTLRNGDGKANPDLSGLLECNGIDFTNITALKLENFPSRQEIRSGHRFSVESFLNLLSIFPNLQFLYFNVVGLKPLNPGQLKQMRDMLPKLHIFRENMTIRASTTGILSAFCGSLRSMACLTWRIPDHPVAKWSLIEEVQLLAEGGIQPLMREIINSLRELKRVRLNTEGGEAATVKAVINDIVVRTAGLEQLSLDFKWSQMSLICEAIDRALFDIVERKRKRLCIELTVRCDEQPKSNDLVYQLRRILNQLASTHIESFLFVCRTWCRGHDRQYLPDQAQRQEELQKFKGQQKNRFNIAFSGHFVAISNKRNSEYNGQESKCMLIQKKWLRRLE